MNKTRYRNEQTDLRRKLRNNATISERVLWHHLRGKRLQGFKFRRQAGIGRYIVDFYCPSARLAIEVDGLVHEGPGVRKYDAIRDTYLIGLDLTVLRFSNIEVLTKIDLVLESISEHLKQHTPPHLEEG